ncbi:MAG TPA: class I tRNA ligase family protein [Gemmatimonadaceae bacterium]|nr:class I tRNA ligase family protein [Gemmatimonadaceae bacterium]
MSRFYVTTAIDYANGDPHIGHAYEKIGTDVIARYRRLSGDDVHFLMGMDEHGQKVAQAAAERGVTPQVFVDDISSRFHAMWERLAISFDQFIRTTDRPHVSGVIALIKRVHESSPDDFYERTYEGWYCVGCELFKRETEIVGGKCVLHPTRELQWTKERNWFFRLSKYQGFLRRLFDERPEFLLPESRRNEILSLLEQGLEDISITRSRLAWAIPFPIASSEGEAQGTWVWFDALPNYLTATGYPARGWRDRWPADLHVIGKDITRLHTIVWPAMLQAAELPLPRQVWAHGFVNVGGERFSKSAGVTLDLREAIERFGPDAFRYFLMREVPFDADGNFSWERFEERYNADLANALGNLASRTIAMVERYRGGVVPRARGTSLDAGFEGDLRAYHAAFDAGNGWLLHEALQAVWRAVARGNEYVDRQAPWKLAKDPALSAQLDETLGALVRQLARFAVMLYPYMPGKATELWTQLGAPGDPGAQRFASLMDLDATGWTVAKASPLFPKEQVTTDR